MAYWKITLLKVEPENKANKSCSLVCLETFMCYGKKIQLSNTYKVFLVLHKNNFRTFSFLDPYIFNS